MKNSEKFRTHTINQIWIDSSMIYLFKNKRPQPMIVKMGFACWDTFIECSRKESFDVGTLR
jgi:hypothetical protein